jgi:exodeoxyribonuclease VII large subunit
MGLLQNMEQFSLFQEKSVQSVAEFLGSVNLEFSKMGVVKIKGEICNVSLRSSYGFFSIKESGDGVKSEAMVGCFLGWKHMSRVQHLLQNGMEVVISGTPSIYVPNGSFRIDVSNIEPVGEGALQKAFEALKLKLSQKGYFDVERKRALPDFVQHVGLITSMSGAAVIDFQKNLLPQGLLVEYMDVRVEGDSAEESIVLAIRKFNEMRPHLDALVVIRGGGSYESLKAFNSESVADSIYFSRIPVITGIGHERDDTIADFVSDVRCSTPTAVASLLQTKRESLLLQLNVAENNLVYTFDGVFEEQKMIVDHETQKLIRNFETVLYHDKTELDSLEYGLQSGLQYIFSNFHSLEENFRSAALQFEHGLQLSLGKLENFQNQLQSLNPEAILERGYSIVYNEKGNVVKSVKSVGVGDELSVRVSDGSIKTKAA